MSFVPERNEFHTPLTMQDNLACENKYLCQFLSFSMLPSLLKRTHTDIIVVPRAFTNLHLARFFIIGDFLLI